MKKVGVEVLFLKTGNGNPRNGEGTFLRLKDGRILFAYTEYYGEEWEDNATARISACYSADEGETWSAPTVLIPKPEDAQNIMSPSLFRLPDGGIGLIFARKDMLENGGVSCVPVFVRSNDEGCSWSDMRYCGVPLGFYCAVNDCVAVTLQGRIYVPLSYHGECRDSYGSMETPPAPHTPDVRLIYSDDNGNSWQCHDCVLQTPYADSLGFAEPGIFVHENGDLWVWMRSGYGHQYHSLSLDGGEHFTPAEPNFRFTTPDAPMRVKRVGDLVAAVYNPLGYSCIRTDEELWGSPRRTPLVVTLSRNDGKSLNDRTVLAANGGFRDIVKNTYYVEDDTSDSYCYPAIQETKDGFLVAYYHSNGTDVCLNTTKMVKIRYDELV